MLIESIILFIIFFSVLAWLTSCCSVVYYLFLEGIIALIFIAFCVRLKRFSQIIGKHSDGIIPWWSYLLWWPFHLLVHTGLSVNMMTDPRLNTIQEVYPGYYLSGWPATRYFNSSYKPIASTGSTTYPETFAAVVDLTCELPRKISIPTQNYLLVSTWDGQPPKEDLFEKAVNFLRARHKKGPVLVHCAYGRGRSVSILIATLIIEGHFKTIDDCLAHIRTARPLAKPNKRMRDAIETCLHHLR